MREIGSWFGLADVEGEPSVVILGAPYDGSVSGRAGAADAPREIRRWSASAEAIDEHGDPVRGLVVRDLGDATVGRSAAATREHLGALADESGARFPDALLVALGGDHSVTPPLFMSVRRRHPDLRLLLLDAHADCFDSYEGDRWSHACSVSRCHDPGGLAPRHTGVVGVRSFALPEMERLQQLGLVVTSAEWMRSDAGAVAARIAASLGGGPLYVSLDIDVLDPSAAPGTGYPVAGGPGSRELLDLLAALWERSQVVALDLVEVAPPLDPTGITAAAAAHALLQVLAHEARRRSGAAR